MASQLRFMHVSVPYHTVAYTGYLAVSLAPGRVQARHYFFEGCYIPDLVDYVDNSPKYGSFENDVDANILASDLNIKPDRAPDIITHLFSCYSGEIEDRSAQFSGWVFIRNRRAHFHRGQHLPELDDVNLSSNSCRERVNLVLSSAPTTIPDRTLQNLIEYARLDRKGPCERPRILKPKAPMIPTGRLPGTPLRLVVVRGPGAS
jgi:hypothetical protein